MVAQESTEQNDRGLQDLRPHSSCGSYHQWYKEHGGNVTIHYDVEIPRDPRRKSN